MEMTMKNEFCALSQREEEMVNGGGVVAFVYAMGFVFGCPPVAVCVAAGAGVVALGVGIYCGVQGL